MARKKDKPLEVQLVEDATTGIHQRMNAAGAPYTQEQKEEATRNTTQAMAYRRAALSSLDHGDQAGYQRAVQTSEEYVQAAEKAVPNDQ